MTVTTVKQACTPSEIVWSDSLADQIAELSDLRDGRIDADWFFRRNHFTEGMERLLYNGFKRLSGESDVGAYYLSQSMGGGKTHNLIAFALLAENPSVRQRVAPGLHPLCRFEGVRTVVFNGHDSPDNFLWGYIADRLDRSSAFARFWKDGARAPGSSDWVELIGDAPTLILLDELPSYLQLAQSHAVGASTLADVTLAALERLFAALPRLPRTCILLTNLRDDVYRSGSNAVKTLIDNLSKQANKYAEEITPVRQNSGEIFQIVRKKLFDELPDEERIEEVAQAYVDALNKAKKLDAVVAAPETFLQRIRESYPFHPSLRDIVARFKENSGYQQTRALIRILRHAVRAAWQSDESVFLIGLQHLDLNVAGAMEEIRKINPNFSNAIARDIADNGNALAEKLDDGKGNRAATSVAKLLLMASLSSAENPVLGLRENETVECLLDPLNSVSEIKDALESLRGKAWYLFLAAADNRFHFGQTANVLAQIQDVATGLSEEVVDRELRAKLREVFIPRERKCYHEVIFALPALDELQTHEDQVRLIILEQPANRLPPEFEQWWRNDERPNRVLVLTADSNAVGTMRNLARQYHATEAVQKAVVARNGKDSSQYREVSDYREKTANQFLSAVREAFKTIVFPSSNNRLREVTDFEMRFDNNDYSGEQQIVEALVKRGKYYTEEKFDENLDTLRLDAEEELFDAKAVPEAELRRKAAAKSGWVWLPPRGLDRLIKECCDRGFWRNANGVVEKGPFAKVTEVRVALEDTLDDGLYRLSVTPINADTVYASESGMPTPDSEKVGGGRWETYGPLVRFLAVDSRGSATTGEVYEWRAPFELEPSYASTPNGHVLSVTVHPKSAEVFVSFDGTSPKDGQPLSGRIGVPADAQRIRLIARAGGQWSEEQQLDPPRMPHAHENRGPRQPRRPRDDLPVLLRSRHTLSSTRETYTALEAMKNVGGVRLLGGKLELKGASDKAWCGFSFGEEVAMSSEDLARLLEDCKRLSGITEVTLRWHRLRFETGRAFVNFAEQAELDWERLDWDHDSASD